MSDNDLEKVARDCLVFCKACLTEGLVQLAGIEDIDPDDLAVREEYGIKSQYMPRGFYCPSKVLEHCTVNIHRGKIAQRRSKKPTNRFLFDKNGRLFYAEAIFPRGAILPEYIFYKDNVVYGITVHDYTFSHRYDISIAVYNNEKISSFLWAEVDSKGNDKPWKVHRIYYETYDHKEDCVLDAYVYHINCSYKLPNASSIWYQKMRFYTNSDNTVSPKYDHLEETNRTINVPLSFQR